MQAAAATTKAPAGEARTRAASAVSRRASVSSGSAVMVVLRQAPDYAAGRLGRQDCRRSSIMMNNPFLLILDQHKPPRSSRLGKAVHSVLLLPPHRQGMQRRRAGLQDFPAAF